MFRTLTCSAIACALTTPACGTSQSKPQASPAPTATSAAATADPSVNAATTAAQAWLALVDEEKYGESWSAAATIFRSVVSEDKWKSSVSGVRGPLGKLQSRQVKSAEFKTSLPGAPDGKYVVIQFRTTFEKKAAAIETVTPMQESDGSWKVSGYFIH